LDQRHRITRDRYVYKNVRSVPPAIKLAVFDEAIAREVTMSDVVGEILGNHFGVTYELSGEKSIGVELEATQFRIQIPRSLQLRITLRSRKTVHTESSVVLGILADHFGIEYAPVRKGRKRAAA